MGTLRNAGVSEDFSDVGRAGDVASDSRYLLRHVAGVVWCGGSFAGGELGWSKAKSDETPFPFFLSWVNEVELNDVPGEQTKEIHSV